METDLRILCTDFYESHCKLTELQKELTKLKKAPISLAGIRNTSIDVVQHGVDYLVKLNELETNIPILIEEIENVETNILQLLLDLKFDAGSDFGLQFDRQNVLEFYYTDDKGKYQLKFRGPISN